MKPNNPPKSKKKVFLGILSFLVAISLYNLTSQTFFNASNEPYKKKMELSPPDNKTITEINYKAQKREFIDSLIENNILTPENLEKAEKLFPDSLCHC